MQRSALFCCVVLYAAHYKGTWYVHLKQFSPRLLLLLNCMYGVFRAVIRTWPPLGIGRAMGYQLMLVPLLLLLLVLEGERESV